MLFLDCALFLQCSKRRERVGGRIGRRFGHIERHAGLTGIGIDPKDEKLGRDQAEVQRIADQGFGLVGSRRGIEIDFRGAIMRGAARILMQQRRRKAAWRLLGAATVEDPLSWKTWAVATMHLAGLRR